MTSLSLRLVHEWISHDPFGRIQPSDAAAGARDDEPLRLSAPRGGYASFRVLVQGRGPFRLKVDLGGGLEADVYRAWFHPLVRREDERPPRWCPDALIPLQDGEVCRLPDPDNRVPGQTAREFWVDVFAPPEVAPGPVAGRIRLLMGREEDACEFAVEVLPAVLPDPPRFVLDNNSYGCRWIGEYFPRQVTRNPQTRAQWGRILDILHHYHRLAHEHRMTFHNLGYGHSGDFDPIYGPRAVGAGNRRRLTDWALFDRYHGPLLDGSLFEKPAPAMPRPRRRPLPAWGIYTPINPDWPARYLGWGEPGYAAEFIRGVREFDAHFRRRGWTRTRVELFFNHKKRYRWFEWDGDEVKYGKDDAYHLEMIRLWKQAIGDSPVPWVYRVDASWRMKQQFDVLACGRNLWVIGGFCAWYPREVRRVLRRGDTVFTYGGYPDLASPSSAALGDVFRAWARGLHGFTEWLTPRPGPDPWFACDGAATGVFYPGERFGIPGPLPSVRLKIVRNAIQDLDLLTLSAGSEEARDRLGRRLAKEMGVALWERPPRAARELPPEEWDYLNLGADHEPKATVPARMVWNGWNRVRKRAIRRIRGEEASR